LDFVNVHTYPGTFIEKILITTVSYFVGCIGKYVFLARGVL